MVGQTMSDATLLWLQILQQRSELGMNIPRLLYTVPVGQNPTGMVSHQ